MAVHPNDSSLSGNNIFAIICVYLFVVFYSFGWGPIPYVLSSECSPNHGRSLAGYHSQAILLSRVLRKLTYRYSPLIDYVRVSHDAVAF